jgi:hypothetical protein
LTAADDHIEVLCFRGVDHRDERGTLLELGARDRVFAVDVLGRNRPSLALDVAGRLFDLHIEACGLMFFRRPACIDRGAHGRFLRPLRPRVENRKQQIDEPLGDDRFVREPHVGDNIFGWFDDNEAPSVPRCCARPSPASCDCVPCTATPRWSVRHTNASRILRGTSEG